MYLLTSKPRAWGGAMHFEYRCTDCKSRMEFDSSARIGDTLRLEVPTLVLLGSLLGGFHFAGYERQMSMIIGDNTASPRTWQTFLHWIQPKIKQLPDTQATAAHDDMKKDRSGDSGKLPACCDNLRRSVASPRLPQWQRLLCRDQLLQQGTPAIWTR